MKLFPLSIALLSFGALASEFEITEAKLKKMSQKSNPSLDQIEATFMASQVQKDELEDKFGFEAYAGYNHANTKEKGQIAFQPVFSNINQYQVGVKKYTKYGVVLDFSSSVDSRSGGTPTADYKDLHTTTNSLSVQMDLWKDFMGSITRMNFDNVGDIKKKDSLQADISKSVLKANVRRLYWSIVANQEKLSITNNLYVASQKQVKNARRRKANSISDKAEVARFESLVHQRKGQLLFLEYEREILFKNLRDVFPELNGKSLKLGAYNLNKSVFEVLECTQKIDAQANVPYAYTKYDEIVSLLRSIQSRQYKVDSSYGDIDLKFDLKLSQIGVSSDGTTDYEGNYQDSLSDIADNDRGAMSAGLMLTIPFGENKAGTVAVKEALTERQFSANINSIESNVRSTHEQVKRSVKLLSHLIKEQKSNSKQLSIRVKEMKRKYSQARIPEYALIQDEDSLLQSDLTVVDTQLQVVNTILDYVAVFNTFPCSFNRE
jgi:outer membrane protein TolC